MDYLSDTKVKEGKTTVNSVMLYIVDTPYHFAKQFRGSCQVNGVIYVVDTKTFPVNHQQVYKEFHEIVGEYHRDKLFCWLVVPDGENYNLVEAPLDWANRYGKDSFTVIRHDKDTNPVITAVCNTLRVNQLLTCHWYRIARPAVSGTDPEAIAGVVQEWFALIRKHLAENESSEVRHMHYPYLSDEEDQVTGSKDQIPYPE